MNHEVAPNMHTRSSEIRELAPKATKRRKANYASGDREVSIKRQRLILALLRVSETGTLTIREVCDATGISRQLAHYHLRKLAYRGQIALVLERGGRPGSLTFRVWSVDALQMIGLRVKTHRASENAEERQSVAA